MILDMWNIGSEEKKKLLQLHLYNYLSIAYKQRVGLQVVYVYGLFHRIFTLGDFKKKEV